MAPKSAVGDVVRRHNCLQPVGAAALRAHGQDGALTGWQDTFVAAGEASLATRSTDGEALETERLKAKLGEMLLERELLDAKIAALEANRPLARRRSRR